MLMRLMYEAAIAEKNNLSPKFKCKLILVTLEKSDVFILNKIWAYTLMTPFIEAKFGTLHICPKVVDSLAVKKIFAHKTAFRIS